MLQKTKNIFHWMEMVAAHTYYGFPARSLQLIGVTGTDGKTTTVTLIAHILSRFGKNVAFTSSVEAVINGVSFDTGPHTTTPYRFAMPKYLKGMAKSKTEYGVLEITSHGLDQYREFGLKFAISVITNITREHLDYHKSFDRYLAAKARIIRKSKMVVLNRDDDSFELLSAYARKNGVTVVAFGLGAVSNIKATEVNLRASESTFIVSDGETKVHFHTHLLGLFNTYNVLAAVSVTRALGVPLEKIAEAVEDFYSVKGRMEVIDLGQKFSCIVDFAHTPNALEQVLKLVSMLTKGRVIIVFGSAGERDRGKRPIMGKIAQRNADLVVITAEDPRSESVEKIMAEVAQGCVTQGGIINKTFWMIPDRREAIRFAILQLVKPTDTVLIAGKGHEKTLTIKGNDLPWSDQEETREAISTYLSERQIG